jgi:peptidoglycan/LPS O-acetylase OafA/YrhL
MQQKNNRMLELDALRGIAALSVFFYHASIYYKESIYFSLFRFGQTGVDLFFIISGFVIFSSIQNKTRIQFIKSRFIRLFPSYWFAVTFTFILILIKFYEKSILNLLPFKQYLINLSMIQEFFKVENLDGPYWTLYIELFFYLIILFFLKKEFFIYLTLTTLMLTTLFVRLNIIPNIFPFSILSTTPISAQSSLFLAGILFYKLMVSKNKLYFLPIVCCLICQTLILKTHYQYASIQDIHFNEHITLLSIFFVLFSFLIYNKLKFLIIKPLLILGNISYMLYLTHQYLTTEIIEYYLVKRKGLNLGISIFFISLPIVLALAYYSNLLIQKLNYKLKILLNKNGLNNHYN